MNDSYLWIKAFHVISVIAWMAGLLYLPRLFVYHCRAEIKSPQSETFKVMERRLYRVIMYPSMIATWVFGALLVHLGGLWFEPWMHGKFLLVIILSASHVAMGKWLREFVEDKNQRTERFYRIANEAPSALMVVIIILAVVKPW